MKKIALGGLVILLLGGYALWSASRSSTPTPVSTDTNATSTGATPTTPADTSNSGTANEDPGIGDSSSPNDTDGYKDGVYTGAIGSAAPYGQVQVRVTIVGRKITKVETIKAPQGPGNTDKLTAETFPIMEKEAIRIQSANVSIVTGATQNTEGFQQSMTSALAQAEA